MSRTARNIGLSQLVNWIVGRVRFHLRPECHKHEIRVKHEIRKFLICSPELGATWHWRKEETLAGTKLHPDIFSKPNMSDWWLCPPLPLTGLYWLMLIWPMKTRSDAELISPQWRRHWAMWTIITHKAWQTHRAELYYCSIMRTQSLSTGWRHGQSKRCINFYHRFLLDLVNVLIQEILVWEAK